MTDIVYVYNTQPRIFHLPDTVKRHTGKVGGEEQQMAVVALGDGKPITPSAPREKDGQMQPTAVDRKYWETHCAKNAQVQTWLRKGWLRIADKPDNGEDEIDDLSRYNETTALTLVGGELNSTLLAAWAKAENRAAVKEAIAKRAEELRAAAKLPPLGKRQ